MSPLSCKTCAGPVSPQSKTGNCRRCALAATNADPVVRERRAAANRRKAADPVFRQKLIRNIVYAGHVARKDPVYLESIRQACRRNLAAAWTPEARAKWYASKKASGEKKTARHFAWCPPDRIAEYRFLTRRKHIRAAEAKRIILDSLTPFERQMQRVRQGAGIVAVQPLPRVEAAFTLGGVSRI